MFEKSLKVLACVLFYLTLVSVAYFFYSNPHGYATAILESAKLVHKAGHSIFPAWPMLGLLLTSFVLIVLIVIAIIALGAFHILF